MNSELFSALVGCFSTLAGVFVGSALSRKNAEHQERLRLLAEFYAEVFTQFSETIPFNDKRKCLLLISSLEKITLLCSAESEKNVTDLICLIASGNATPEDYNRVYRQLRKSAKKEMSDRYCR